MSGNADTIGWLARERQANLLREAEHDRLLKIAREARAASGDYRGVLGSIGAGVRYVGRTTMQLPHVVRPRRRAVLTREPAS